MGIATSLLTQWILARKFNKLMNDFAEFSSPIH